VGGIKLCMLDLLWMLAVNPSEAKSKFMGILGGASWAPSKHAQFGAVSPLRLAVLKAQLSETGIAHSNRKCLPCKSVCTFKQEVFVQHIYLHIQIA